MFLGRRRVIRCCCTSVAFFKSYNMPMIYASAGKLPEVFLTPPLLPPSLHPSIPFPLYPSSRPLSFPTLLLPGAQ